MTRTSLSRARRPRSRRQLSRYIEPAARTTRQEGAARICRECRLHGVRRPADEEAEAPPAPPIVAETRVDIPEASVSDAVMMMDLRNTNALMFRNRDSGEYNMVYRRDDGTIGWVEPRPSDAAISRLTARSLVRRSRPVLERIVMQLVRVSRFRGDPARPSARQQARAAPAARRSSPRQRLGVDPRRSSPSLAERERLGSTGFGDGVAIPHGKIDGLDRVYACSRGLASRSIIKRSTGAGRSRLPAACPRPMPGPSI